MARVPDRSHYGHWFEAKLLEQSGGGSQAIALFGIDRVGRQPLARPGPRLEHVGSDPNERAEEKEHQEPGAEPGHGCETLARGRISGVSVIANLLSHVAKRMILIRPA